MDACTSEYSQQRQQYTRYREQTELEKTQLEEQLNAERTESKGTIHGLHERLDKALTQLAHVEGEAATFQQRLQLLTERLREVESERDDLRQLSDVTSTRFTEHQKQAEDRWEATRRRLEEQVEKLSAGIRESEFAANTANVSVKEVDLSPFRCFLLLFFLRATIWSNS